MSGAQLFVQPSQLDLSLIPPTPAGTWVRGIPTPGVISLAGVPAVAGIATCRNLLAMSPPTLLEAYEIHSYSIGFAAFVDTTANPTDVSTELAILVNDTVRSTEVITQPGILIGGAGISWLSTGAFTSDLVNPIVVGARDRLSLRVGVMADEPNNVGGFQFLLGIQTNGNANVAMPYESTLSYRTLAQPGARRL